MDIRENTLESEQDINSVGFIMIKPHAMRFGYDTLITDILSRVDFHREALGINISDESVALIRDVSVLRAEYRCITPDSNLLRALYHDNLKVRGDDHLKTLSKFFVGDAFFLIVGSQAQPEELYKALSELKGKSTLLTRDGEIARRPSGLRGVLIEPQLKLDGEPVTAETEHLLYNNIIHTSDNEFESALMCRTLFPQINSISGNKINAIKAFINTHIPVSIVPFEG